MKHTIFEGSPVPLAKWFYAVFLMAQTPEGVSAKSLERELQVTYPTAWRMAKRIRAVRPDNTHWAKPIFIDMFLQNCMLHSVQPFSQTPLPAESISAVLSPKKRRQPKEKRDSVLGN